VASDAVLLLDSPDPCHLRPHSFNYMFIHNEASVYEAGLRQFQLLAP
jgi:hypothetical protein